MYISGEIHNGFYEFLMRFMQHNTLKFLTLYPNIPITFHTYHTAIREFLIASKKPKIVILNFHDHILQIRNMYYNYYTPHINVILYYRSLCLSERCFTSENNYLRFLCCYSPIWVVIQVCDLLKE